MEHKRCIKLARLCSLNCYGRCDAARSSSKRVMRILSGSRLPVVSRLGRTILIPAQASCAQYSSTWCVHSHAWGVRHSGLGGLSTYAEPPKHPRRMITANRRPSWNSNGQGHYYVIHQQPLSNYPCIDLCFLTCAAYPTSPLQSALPACCILSVEGRSGGAQ